MEICSKIHCKNLVEWAANRPEVVVLSADLTSSTEIDLFRDTYPERFFSMGVAEQNMISFAGGLAREGFTPYVHTFAVFIYRRAFDQIAVSVAYPNLPVRMMGFLPGIMTPGGATHQAIEDIAVLRALPNMTILECGDATEVESVLDAAQPVPGPVYVRMLRGEVPRLFPASEPMQVGKARVLSEGTDLVVFSSGICTEEALRAISLLQDKGLSIRHLHISTLKPFDDPAVLEALEGTRYGAISLENHSIVGGLGSALAEMIAENGMAVRLMRLGLADCFMHGASRKHLAREYGIDALELIRAVERLIGHSVGIDTGLLASVHIMPVHSRAKAEAL